MDFAIRIEDKKRNRFDILRDVLATASNKVKKTRIMYGANLNYHQVEKYLGILLEKGLLACDPNDGSYYLITEKGELFLKVYVNYVEHRLRLIEEINGTEKHRQLLESLC